MIEHPELTPTDDGSGLHAAAAPANAEFIGGVDHANNSSQVQDRHHQVQEVREAARQQKHPALTAQHRKSTAGSDAAVDLGATSQCS